ncbi:MAG TPA: TldD/PmbA family protein [Bdellovibrionota bacterium]|nr:TldD/PmbA family protein [Bdellovibrionota bacterium]
MEKRLRSEGYIDVRRENLSSHTFYVREGKIENSIRSERSGHIFRVAGRTGFDIVPDRSTTIPKDAAFARFVRERWEREANRECLFENNFEPVKIPTTLVEAAHVLADKTMSFRFFWEARQIEFENNLGFRKSRLELVRVVTIERRQRLKRTSLHLRRFVFDPQEEDLRRETEDTEKVCGTLQDADTLERDVTCDVVLHPTVTAVLIHEMFGHSCEADRYSRLGSLVHGNKISSVEVAIEDVPDETSVIDHLPFDEEGLTAGKVTLVREGVVQNMLHTFETAFAFKTEPNGRGRARDFRYWPITRMMNIRMMPGTAAPDELIAAVRNGFYLVGTLGAVTTGTIFQIQCQYGYEIKNGQLGKPVIGPILRGSIASTALAIQGVARDAIWVADGGCLFGNQFLHRSGRGGPHVLVSNIVVS